MTTPDFTVSRTDVGKVITAVCPADLTGATSVVFRMGKSGDTPIVNNATATPNPDQVGHRGEASWVMTAPAVATAGEYEGQFIAEWGGGAVRIHFPVQPFTILVERQVSDPIPAVTVTTGSTCTPWATPDDLRPPCDTAVDAVLMEVCLQAASDVLFHLSGMQYPGGCTATVRPISRSIVRDHGRPVVSYGWGGLGWGGAGWGGGGWGPFDASPLTGGCGCGEEEWGCGTVPAISLGTTPVTGIVEVRIGGVVVDPATYRVDDMSRLVRMDGAGGWPCCQQPNTPADAAGAFVVTFRYGTPPPPAGKLAAAELACQLALAISPQQAGDCSLPQRVTQVTRQGETMILLDPMTFLQEGRTGLYWCDLFLLAVNPAKLQRQSVVMSPDVGPAVTRPGQ